MQVELPFEVPWEFVENYLAGLIPDVQAVLEALERERSDAGSWSQFEKAIQEKANIKGWSVLYKDVAK